MQTAAAFELGGETLQQEFDRLHGDGFRVVSLASFGPDTDPRYAVLWHQTWGPQQILVRDTPFSQLVQTITGHTQAGMHPAIVAVMVDMADFVRFAIVFEELVATPGHELPRMILAESRDVLVSRVGNAADRLYLRSIAGAGRRGRGDVGGSGAEPYFAATFWPQPADGPWRATGLRVEAADPDWRFQWPAVVQRAHAHVLAAGGATTRAAPDDAYSIWTDERFDPWPIPDPMALDPMAIGDLLRVDRGNLEAIVQRFAEREQSNYFPLSLTAHGDSLKSATWHAVWAPPHAWSPLPRKFIVQGPGDGRGPAHDVPEHVPGPPRRFGAIRRAGRPDVHRMNDLYAVREIAPGHVQLLPRDGAWVHRDLESAADSSSGLSAGGDMPTPTSGAPLALSAFDTVMRRMMNRGARAAYLVVLRRGELKFARAYTFAEEGYPVTTLDHRVRVASVSKPILATLLVRQCLQSPGGLNRVLAPELEVQPYFDVLASATIEDALRHATGFATTTLGPISHRDVFKLANDDLTSQALEQLGTMRLWYGGTMNPVHVPYENLYESTATPQQEGERVQAYNNWVYSCLGELYGRRSERGAFEEWPRSVADELSLAGVTLDWVLGGRSYKQCREQGEILYQGRPAVSPRRWTAAEEPLPYVAVPYDQDVDALGCATAIVISPLDMARFLAAMTPRPGRFSWLTPEQLPRLYSTDPRVPDGDGYGLGWAHESKDWDSHRLGATINVERIHHNGALIGTSAYLEHLVPHDPALADETFSFALAINAAVPRGNIAEEIRKIAKAIEAANAWPSGDLLDAL